MKAVRTDAAADLQAAIAALKFRAEVEEFGMLAYLLGMAEAEAREIATGERRVIERGSDVIEIRREERTVPAAQPQSLLRRLFRWPTNS